MDDRSAGEAAPLRFRADWGGANLVRAAGWLAQYVWDHTDDRRRSVIHTGRGMGDNLRALAAGEVDVALATPAAFARLAREGRGPFADEPLTNLVAIAALPHRDAMLPAARRDLGFSNLADMMQYDGPLRVALEVNDRDGFMGLACDIVLDATRVDLDQIVARGGSVVRYEQPFDAVDDLREGRVDVMISEAIMTPDWQRLASEAEVTFLSLSDQQSTWIAERWGLAVLDVPAHYFPGQDQPVTALDYSDWIVATTTDLPEDVARLLARAFVEDTEYFARGYRHLPVEYSPLRYPIDYRLARRTSLPLHPAVEAEYDRYDIESRDSLVEAEKVGQ